ncbi:kelch repeat-containing protein [Paenibacillus sp. P46E]|uniref:Kelch repeat-containing protein n=1 Tax=Paenibacillus sp. P46E TaxID=1349436 RepID=UPI00093E2ED5|nr:kelch repeat-containing protein [Paenibacillus sp. P46E]OKP94366.1 hypothetical protein A3849_29460 [Paenibacillus sp. P46E]
MNKKLLKLMVTCLTALILCFPVSAKASADTEGWEYTTPMPKAMYGFGTTSLNDKIYLIGGRSNNPNVATYNSLLVYDPTLKAWETKAPMSTSRYMVGVAQVNGKIYAIGGYDASDKPTKILEEYDPLTNTWTSKAEMLSTQRQGFSVSVVNNKIYVLGGTVNMGQITYNVEQYDPISNQWSIIKNDFPRTEMANTVTLNKKIYIIGGSEPEIPYSQRVLEYDPVSGSVVKKSNMPTGRYQSSASLVNGKILVIGGITEKSKGRATSIVEEYDPKLDKWETGISISTSRRWHSSETALNKTFVFGGYSDELKPLDSVEVSKQSSVPEPNPDPTEPNSNRALLTITLTTGIEKEFDLSIEEVNAFLKWYDAKDAGSGPAKFAIDKHSNNKGPFSKRSDYVIFKNILSFEVDEYSTVTSATYK